MVLAGSKDPLSLEAKLLVACSQSFGVEVVYTHGSSGDSCLQAGLRSESLEAQRTQRSKSLSGMLQRKQMSAGIAKPPKVCARAAAVPQPLCTKSCRS